jgi:hypothetical protein
VPEPLTQLGVGGLLAYLIIKEVLSFLKNRTTSSNGNSGEKPVSFWEQHIGASVQSAIDLKMVPHLEQQTEVLKEIRDSLKQMNDRTLELVVSDRAAKGRGAGASN